MSLFSRLEEYEQRYEDLSAKMADPDLLANPTRLRETAIARADLEEVVEAYKHYKKLQKELADNTEMMRGNDPELAEMAREEVTRLKEEVALLETRMKFLMLPKDPWAGKNVLLEIRAGTGGDEAGIFAGDLYGMYNRYCDSKGWKTEVLEISPADKGGYKEIIMSISGKDAYTSLKYESGVHRVQRVPETESQGRKHTSTATVAVMPEAEEVDVAINESDLKIDVYRASGAGGQHVNKTESAVRITHLPTGIVVTCQDERSQHKNRAKAMKVLRSRMLEQKITEQNERLSSERKGQVGTGDRSERIRTYNFHQGRITDHRIGLSLYNFDAFLLGEIQEMVDALSHYYQAEALKQQETGA